MALAIRERRRVGLEVMVLLTCCFRCCCLECDGFRASRVSYATRTAGKRKVLACSANEMMKEERKRDTKTVIQMMSKLKYEFTVLLSL